MLLNILVCISSNFPTYKILFKVRRKQIKGRCITDPGYDEVNNCFERSLVFMHKMPRIWIDYCKFLVKQQRITRTRRVMDRALRALPPTQHDRIWPIYIKFVRTHPIPETGVRVFRRYIQMFPENSEEYIDYLIYIDRFLGFLFSLRCLIFYYNFLFSLRDMADL